MAPYPVATPAPVPAATNPFSAYLTTTAPLTTVFTPPAACATNLPTVIAGDCNGLTSCSSYGSADFSSYAFADFNPIWWTTDWKQAGALSCYPSGYSNFKGFTFSPAIGCPVGYATITWSSMYYGSDNAIVCCPSGFSSAYYATSYSNYRCWRWMKTGETAIMVAVGGTSLSDSTGSFFQYIETFSTIKTTTFSTFPGGHSSLVAYATALELRVAKSLISGTPIMSSVVTLLTTSDYDWPYSFPTTATRSTELQGIWSTYDGKPHLFHLGFAATIAVMCAFLVAFCCGLAMCRGCWRSRRRPAPRPNIPPRPTPVHQSIPPTTTPAVAPVLRYGQSRVPGSAIRPPSLPSERSERTPLCAHKYEASCTTGVRLKCCRCLNRPTSLKPDVELVRYCDGCFLSEKHVDVVALLRLPRSTPISDATTCGYSLFLHAKLQGSTSPDDRPNGLFWWLSQRSARCSYSPPSSSEGIFDWGPTYDKPRFSIALGGRLKPRLSSPDPRSKGGLAETNTKSDPSPTIASGGVPPSRGRIRRDSRTRVTKVTVTQEDTTFSARPDPESNITDDGPTYSPPKLEVPIGATAAPPSTASLKVIWSTSETTKRRWKEEGLDLRMMIKSIALFPKRSAAQSNVTDLGPAYSPPTFEIPSDAPKASPAAASSSAGEVTSETTPATGRRRWDRGLQRNAPKFQVSGSGTISE
ncbi:hypothetical protein BCR34DRAFT_582729 [Clohesyomyces aquaticus]|uniref:Uncharacterized protein n=1 Tax=Clohesyomyces aquaticus TaxID=1231657 RepID=A0A1Y2A909_9PLEO|nr:hypothetical protein BCR34DRAFT_582729 [Clohesyomyces aquaticus]